MKTKFSVVRNAMNTEVTRMTGGELRLLTAGLATPIEVYRKNDDQDTKRRLPAVCWAADFSDGIRHAISAEATGLGYVDIDHVEDPIALYAHAVCGREEELGVVHAQVSPSGHGLHIVFIPRVINSIAQAQEDFCRRVGIGDFDRQCKDLPRMLFLSSIKDTLYDALDFLEDDEEEGEPSEAGREDVSGEPTAEPSEAGREPSDEPENPEDDDHQD